MDLTAFGLVVDRSTRVPGGYTADCYRVTCGAEDYLVKAFRSGTPGRALRLLRALHAGGLPVVPPVPTLAGELTGSAGGREIAVFPYVTGVVPPDWPYWPDDLLRRLGAVLAGVHRFDTARLVPPPPLDRLEPPPAWLAPPPGGYAADVSAQSRRLASLSAPPFRPVLCHTDFAGDNLLVTCDGVVVLDWDEAVLGPAEIDMMLFLTPDGQPFARMLDGYRAAGGDTAALSLRRLEYCALRRYLGDAAVRAGRLADPSAPDAARAEALAGFEAWGVRMWRRLDASLGALARVVGP